MGQYVTVSAFAAGTGRILRFAAVGVVVAFLAGCNLFGPPKIKEEPIIPAESLYNSAIADMDAQRYLTAIKTLEKLERQHP